MSIDLTQEVRPALTEQVAEEIRVVMTRRRIKQSDLARALGKSEQWVSVRLRGVQPIDLNDLQVIADAIGATPADLLPRPSEGHVVAISGSSRRQTTVSKKRQAKRPSPFGYSQHGTPRSSTRRPVFV